MEELQPPRRLAGFSWNKKTKGAVGPRELSEITERVVINPIAKKLAEDLKVHIRRMWFAPPGLTVEDPRKWWNLIAAAFLSGRASGEAWIRLFSEHNELNVPTACWGSSGGPSRRFWGAENLSER